MQFRPIPGFPSYELSRSGQVRRTRPYQQFGKGWVKTMPGRVVRLYKAGKLYHFPLPKLLVRTFGMDRRQVCAYRKGEQVHGAKLKEADIPEIKALHRQGMVTELIGPMFGVSGSSIRSVIRGKTWKHVRD